MEIYETPKQCTLRNWSYVDVENAKRFIKEELSVDEKYISRLNIRFDVNGHIIRDGLGFGLIPDQIKAIEERYKKEPAGTWVYNILADIGYQRFILDGWKPTFYEDGCLNHDGLAGIIGWKNIDILHRRLQILGLEPGKKELSEVDEMKREREYFSDNPILTDLNRNMRALIEAEGYAEEAPPQSTFVIEETSELVVELMKLVKILCKEERKKVTREEVFGEACDVMATIMMFFVKNGYPTHDVFTYISGKYRRAAERFSDNNEI